MRIFISGICGTGMGPLALMAHEAGMEVFGTDRAEGAVSPELAKAGIDFETGVQDGQFLQKKIDETGVDWFVYTSALPDDHPELVLAKKAGIRASKRDELISYLVSQMGLKMVAIAGTHGKTTTTSMVIWACQQMNIPVSYLVGTTLPFAESGKYDSSSEFLVYEADEYDRNFLHFNPWLGVITTVSYDHPDIYKTEKEYKQAFQKFASQCEDVIYGEDYRGDFTLAGEARRIDAALAAEAVTRMGEEAGIRVEKDKLVQALNDFPGAGRRFERVCEGVYTDYGHHPEEIAATVKMAKEEAQRLNLKGVVVVYEPHQNTRQYEVKDGYREAFLGADKVYWLPTYLTRENPDLKVLTPEDFIAGLANKEVAEPAEMDEKTAENLKNWQKQGYLVLLMTAGPADAWLRKIF